eukprot:jgi/Ulvmu1/12429/UM009_0080.1
MPGGMTRRHRAAADLSEERCRLDYEGCSSAASCHARTARRLDARLNKKPDFEGVDREAEAYIATKLMRPSLPAAISFWCWRASTSVMWAERFRVSAHQLAVAGLSVCCLFACCLVCCLGAAES